MAPKKPKEPMTLIHLRVPVSLKQKLAAEAVADSRSLNAVIVLALLSHTEKSK
jgi:predicted HicB family RNase H-like nuclease